MVEARAPIRGLNLEELYPYCQATSSSDCCEHRTGTVREGRGIQSGKHFVELHRWFRDTSMPNRGRAGRQIDSTTLAAPATRDLPTD